MSGFLGVFAAILLSGPLAGATARVTIERARLESLAERSRGLYTEAAFTGAFSDMGPAALSLARRFDPAAGQPLFTAEQLAVEELAPELEPKGEDLFGAEAINAANPFSTAPNPAARPFVIQASAEDYARAVNCLTQAVYYEAGFESEEGGRAVAQVVLNRMRHPIFPKTVCGVVYQGSHRTTGCQFSFTCDGALARAPAADAWKRARRIAQEALTGHVVSTVGGATHYHTTYVAPWWMPTVTKVAKIGAHIFYRWPGGLGLPGAFNGRYAGGERIYQANYGKKVEPAATLQAALGVPVERTPEGRVRAVFRVAGADVTTHEIDTPDGGTAVIATLGPGSVSASALVAPQTQAERIAARAYMQKSLKPCSETEPVDPGALCRKW